MPWVFLEKRESLFIIVSRVLLAEELVGESETCQARGLGTRQAQEVRGGGATTDPMAMSEQRASPKHCPLSPKTQNQKPQAKTYKSVTERHQMHLVSTREKRGDGPMCRALLCRQRIKTNDDPKKKKTCWNEAVYFQVSAESKCIKLYVGQRYVLQPFPIQRVREQPKKGQRVPSLASQSRTELAYHLLLTRKVQA